MPSTTILSPVNTDTVPTTFEVYVAYDLINALPDDYLLKCSVNADEQECDILSGSATVGTKTFTFTSVTTTTANITAKLFRRPNTTDPIATDAETVTVQDPPPVTITPGGAFTADCDSGESSDKTMRGTYSGDVDPVRLKGAVQGYRVERETGQNGSTRVKRKEPRRGPNIPIHDEGRGVWSARIPAGHLGDVEGLPVVFYVTGRNRGDRELGQATGRIHPPAE